MPFGTDNLNYGEGFGDDAFGSGGAGYTGLEEGDEGYGSQYGGSIYDEYMGDTIISTDVEVSDYLYTYDPLKEQNLLADYMSGLTDLGDKTEGVRTKAIAERKALSKSIKGGLTSGTMESMEKEGMAAASRAQAGLYRAQGSAKRGLGEAIGSLRQEYESDIASSVEAYNAAVGGDGATQNEIDAEVAADGVTEANIRAAGGDIELARYQTAFGLDWDGDGTERHGYGTQSAGHNNDWGEHGDTWYKTNTKQPYHYYDEGVFYDGHWKSGKGGHW